MAGDIFEQASRMKLRYETPKGPLLVEDLWDYPLRAVDDLAVRLMNELKIDNISFINEKKPDVGRQLAFDVIRRVIEVRMEEKKAANEAKIRAEQKQKILGIIARKEEGELEGR